MSLKNKKIFKNIPVIDIAKKGKTISKTKKNEIIFLNNGVPGDIVDVEVYKKKKNFFLGNIINYKKHSKNKIEPKCEHFDLCGGCQLQNISYEFQLKIKSKLVKDNFERIAEIKLNDDIEIVPSDEKYYYRNKLEFTFSNKRWLTSHEIKTNKKIIKNGLGFHKAGMWDKIIDINNCHLQIDISNKIRNFIKIYSNEKNLMFFDHNKKSGLLRNLMIKTTISGEIMVLIQFYINMSLEIKNLLISIKNKFPQINSLLYVINNKANDTIYDQKIHLFYGKKFIVEKFGDLSFKISAKSFYQTNPKQALKLYEIIKDFCRLKGDELIYDLYTGNGTIAQFISDKASKIIGIDLIDESIKNAIENSKINNIKNVEFLVGDMKNIFDEKLIKKYGKPSVIITDPPRNGMHSNVINEIIKINPEKIIYVSCNSATQARDLKILKKHYEISKMKIIDMFPQTLHVENVVLLKKLKL